MVVAKQAMGQDVIKYNLDHVFLGIQGVASPRTDWVVANCFFPMLLAVISFSSCQADWRSLRDAWLLDPASSVC